MYKDSLQQIFWCHEGPENDPGPGIVLIITKSIAASVLHCHYNSYNSTTQLQPNPTLH